MITIVDYGVCNVGSLANMLKKIGQKCEIVSDPEQILRSEKLILPGVGSFDAGMQRLKSSGLDQAVKFAALDRKVPLMGICLGMQLLGRSSEEGESAGLGLIAASARKFSRDGANSELRIPHMGWSYVRSTQRHKIFNGLTDGSRFYFVHSYHVECDNQLEVLGTTEYGKTFSSVIAHDNILGVQFHPEKSHRFGMTLLKNFAEI